MGAGEKPGRRVIESPTRVAEAIIRRGFHHRLPTGPAGAADSRPPPLLPRFSQRLPLLMSKCQGVRLTARKKSVRQLRPRSILLRAFARAVFPARVMPSFRARRWRCRELHAQMRPLRDTARQADGCACARARVIFDASLPNRVRAPGCTCNRELSRTDSSSSPR